MSPAVLPPLATRNRITKFTNGRILKGNCLVQEELWVSASTGKIVRSQEAFYEHQVVPDTVVDLRGRIVSPGFIDVQLNGALGFDFSAIPDDMATYGKELNRINRGLIRTGVTSYLPTLTSQRPYVYNKALPFLGPSGALRLPESGSESLGAHCEGPFLNPSRSGIHNTDVLLSGPNGFADLESCYGSSNLQPGPSSPDEGGSTRPPSVKMITAAPELGCINSAIGDVTSRGIIFSIGHSDATYEQASAGVEAGATMITHLFNAMRPLHHRNPGIFGLLGTAQSLRRPYFGIIADGIHLHPTSIKIAFNAYPDGFILVTDAMHLVGLEDGIYDSTNAERIVKKGALLTLLGSDKIAGSSITLIECVNNFLNWSGASIPEALKAVTATPARMLGLSEAKGTLESDADADLVILDEITGENGTELVIDQVWKFGQMVFDRA